MCVLRGDIEGPKPGTKRIAEVPKLFYQRHLAQVTVTCIPAAAGMSSYTERTDISVSMELSQAQRKSILMQKMISPFATLSEYELSVKRNKWSQSTSLCPCH